MPIVIKELFPSDPLSEALEKINFNFDQLVLAGGGPPGPQGPQGVPGIPGPQGERGDHWQAGATAPTLDHGPNFGSLKDYDFWLDAGGTVHFWDAGSTAWIATSVNLRGPQGSSGSTGGSFEMAYHQGATGNAIPPTYGGQNYVPKATPSTTPSTDAGFIIPRQIDINSLFLGDAGWSYNKLNNFNVKDTIPPVVPGINPASQRLNPKLTVIQTGIDYTGFGGLTIGAYGATDGTSPVSSLIDYVGSTAINTDAYNFFTAGFAINEPTIGNINHIFKAGTRKIDFELFAGDLLNSSIFPGSSPNLILRTTPNGQVRLMNTGSTNPRAIFDETYTLIRPKTSIGHLTPPTWDPLSTFDNAGVGRNRGAFLVGDLSGTSSQIGVGAGRTVAGQSKIDLYGKASPAPATTSLQSFVTVGLDNTILRHDGTGSLHIFSNNNTVNSPILFSTAAAERMRITHVGAVGIGTTDPKEIFQIGDRLTYHNGGIKYIGFNSYFDLGASTNKRIVQGAASRIVHDTSTGSISFDIAGFGGTGANIPFTNELMITSNGVGVNGITSPLASLHISSSNFQNLRLDSSTADLGISLYPTQSPFSPSSLRSSFIGHIGSIPATLILGKDSAGSIRLTTNWSGSSGNINLQANQNGSTTFGTTDMSAGSRVEILGDAGPLGEFPLILRTPVYPGWLIHRNGLVFQKAGGGSFGNIQSGTILGTIGFGGLSGGVWSKGLDGGIDIYAISSGTWNSTNKPANLVIGATRVGASGVEEAFSVRGDSGKIRSNWDLEFYTDSSIDTNRVISAVNNGIGEGNIGITQAGPGGNASIYLRKHSTDSRYLVGINTGNVDFGDNTNSPIYTTRIHTGASTNNSRNSGGFQIVWNPTATVPNHEFYGRNDYAAQRMSSGNNNTVPNPARGIAVGPGPSIVTEIFNTGADGGYTTRVVQNSSVIYDLIIPDNQIGASANGTPARNGGLWIWGGGDAGGIGGTMRLYDRASTDLNGTSGLDISHNLVVRGRANFGGDVGSTTIFNTIASTSNARIGNFGTTWAPSSIAYSGGETARIHVEGLISAQKLYLWSDSRLKNEIAEPIEGNSLERLVKLKPRLFEWNEKSPSPGIVEFGFFAQEVKEHVPEAVYFRKTSNFDDEHMIHHNTLLTLSISAIQDQQRIIKTQGEKILSLEEKISKIEKMLNI